MEKLEEYKKSKIEYDKKIRDLDCREIDLSVCMYNSKKGNLEEKEFRCRKEIDKIEKQKQELTENVLEDIEKLKSALLEKIDNEIKKNPTKELTIMKFYINKINSVYFDIKDVEEIASHFYTESQVKVVEKEESKAIAEPVIKPVVVNTFNIKEQRVIDFKNMLGYTSNISKKCREEAENCINIFKENYEINKNIQTLKIEFDEIFFKYVSELKQTLAKVKKQENLSELNRKIENIELSNKDIISQNEELLLQNKNMKNQLEELKGVHLVNGYANKITQNLNDSGMQQDENINNEESIFQEIKEMTQNERKVHVEEVGNWSWKVENSLRNSNIADIQPILNFAMQTQNMCISGYDEIAGYIIYLCNGWIKYDELDNINQREKAKLSRREKDIKILRNGIESIRKKYTKIPFIGKKIACILNLNAKRLTE